MTQAGEQSEGQSAPDPPPVQPLGLGAAAAKGAVILGVATGVEYAAQLLRAFFLARILSPHDFGLAGMAFVLIFTAETLSQTGFQRAIVQRKDNPDVYLDTVWVTSALRGFLLYALAWFLAPLAARFFATPEVVSILRAAALAFPIQGLLNPAYLLLERDLSFVRYAVPRVSGVVIELLIVVPLALMLRSVWAIVWGFLAGKIAYVALSYSVRPYMPSAALRMDLAAELYRYGKHIFRASVADCILGQGDRAVVGRLLGAEPLGLYSFAGRVASLPSTGVYGVVLRVAFPIFSRIQDDAGRLRSGFLRALGLMAALALPLAAGMAATTDDLVSVLLGAKWAGMIPAFRVLCAAAAFTGLFNLTQSMLAGIGKPEKVAHGEYLFLLVFAVPLYPAVKTWGILGAAACSAVAAAAALVFLLAVAIRTTQCGTRAALRTLASPALASLGMALAVMVVREVMAGASGPLRLAVSILTGAAAYGLALAGLDRLFGSELTGSVRSIRGALRRRAQAPSAGTEAPLP